MSEKCSICGNKMDLGKDGVWRCDYCGNDTANRLDKSIPVLGPPKKDNKKKGGWW